MPTVTLNRKVFERLVGKSFPIEKLKDRISYLGTDLESVESDKIVVEVFPNRPDMLSEQGFARAFSSFVGVKTGLKKYNIKKSGFKVIVDRSVTMRPYTACALVKNMKFTDERIKETMQLQEKLSTTHGRARRKSEYGIYPSVKIKFPVRYIAKDPKTVTFVPLGMNKPIRADRVEQLHHTGKAFKHITEGWKKYPFFIDASGKVLSMLPYTNSNDTGKVDETTKEIFIECTGTNLENVNTALNILVTTFADMGGEIYSIEMVYPNKKITTPNLTPKKMKIDCDYVNKLLDLKLSKKQIFNLLKIMGYGEERGNVLIPAYRGDVMHQMDLVEDVAIAYGYENFEPEIPNIATVGSEDEFSVFASKVANIMVGLGFIETSTYHLTNKRNLNEKMLTDMDFIEIDNSKNSEYNVLRSWMIPSLMNVLGSNTRYEYPQRLFEIGTVFKKGGKETGVQEFSRLGVVICDKDMTFTDMKQVMDSFFNSLNVKYGIKGVDHPSFISGRVGRVSVKGKKIAYIGEIHPQVLENFGIEQPVCAFEVNLSDMLEILKK
ncbi:MAG: phenylalanine--tRNA ligase subunit beta [Candidatus Aenigmarchaeota archaeon]|nr:phenylalanine--tRNA ligase subunit beta [Candidatus Aenigmarchaeota archaeon]NIP39919.1 phenylalanine--tRNA ligase subunit beta [Candidatus Aenigmarchaeota archaeon]NIQ17638.1 phenylalanine--tRNA ligase subunit beta [Candidatus Aenigmarchaeota archaeon]NIS72826.1 phenylalanine--tRNA ligase subunit beta [Candidatus Aenigmarchaeota archaeon]